MKLASYRMVEDIPAPEGVVTPEGDRVMMVDLASASLRESALRERIRELEKHRDLLQRRVTYWYNRYSDVMSLHEDENRNLKAMVEGLENQSKELEQEVTKLRSFAAAEKVENRNLNAMVEGLNQRNLKLNDENEELRRVQEDLIKRALERILDETT